MPVSVLNELCCELLKIMGKKSDMVQELADVLQISNESVYRRLRGASSFTLEEMWKLRQEYQLSLDELLDDDNQTTPEH